MNPRLGLVLLAGLTGLVLAAALFGTHTYFYGEENTELSTPRNSRYYLTDPVVYQFDKQGRLTYKLTAERSLYLQNEAVEMRQPRMRHYGDTPGYWWFAARKGYIPPGHERIRLNRNVRAISHNTDKGKTKVHTSRAWIHPDRNLVTSSRHVVARTPTQRITGNGMHLNLKTNQLRILNNAQVTYYQ